MPSYKDRVYSFWFIVNFFSLSKVKRRYVLLKSVLLRIKNRFNISIFTQ